MPFSEEWQAFRRATDFDEYATRWDRLEAAGHDVHGEADFVMQFGSGPDGWPSTVLDAGCGAGRVAVELARRGVDVTAVDLDEDLLQRAKTRSSAVTWIHADLAELDLSNRFDCVVLAGNVLPYVEPLRQADAFGACARHLASKGRLIMGMNLRPGWPTTTDIEQWMNTSGLVELERFAGWGHEVWAEVGTEPSYVVVVAQLR